MYPLFNNCHLLKLKVYPFVQGCIQQFTGENVVEIVREEKDLLLLPQDLWCSLQEGKDGQRLFSVGWLFEPGHAITSTCVFSSDSKLEVNYSLFVGSLQLVF